MLKITVELIPYGIDSQKRKIGESYIINEGGKRDFCDYSCIFTTIDTDETQKTHIKNFDRQKGFWSLLYESLKQIKIY